VSQIISPAPLIQKLRKLSRHQGDVAAIGVVATVEGGLVASNLRRKMEGSPKT
jgi:hypothetical protein